LVGALPDSNLVARPQALRQATLASLGIVLLPEMMLENDLSEGTLVRLFPDLPAPTFPVHIVHLPERTLTAKLASFVDFTIVRFGPARD